MNKVELIKAEIERLKENIGIGLSEYDMGHENGVWCACTQLLSFINSLPEEPVSEELEEAVDGFCYLECDGFIQVKTVKFKSELHCGDKVKVIVIKAE